MAENDTVTVDDELAAWLEALAREGSVANPRRTRR